MDVRGAVAGRLHDDRVDEPHEWRVRDAVVDLQRLLVIGLDLQLVDRRLRLEHLGLASDAGSLNVLAARNGDVDGIAGGDAQLVDAVNVRGVGDSDPKAVADQRDRDGYDALQRAQRDQLDSIR